VIARWKRELGVAAVLAALLVLLALAAPRFFSSGEPRSIAVRSAPVLVAAVGLTLVLLARQIDISVGSQISVAGVAAGLLAKAGLPAPLAALGAVGVGALLGAVNGALVAGLGLPSIVATLATMVAFQESLRLGRQGEFVKEIPDGFQWFGLGQAGGEALLAFVALAVFAAFAWGLRHLAGGRAVYAVGSDAEAARLAGIRPRRVVFAVFVLSGALAGLAAALDASRFPLVDPNMGKGLEMQVIAAVVVGGVAVTGGRGRLLGVLPGVLLLLSIGSALVFLGVPPQWEKAAQGAIILVAVGSDALNLRTRRHARPSLVPA
jgi:rhamnose transport system permease protein